MATLAFHPFSRLPVIYVFARHYSFDSDQFISQLQTKLPAKDDEKYLVFYDPRYDYLLSPGLALHTTLLSLRPDIQFASLSAPELQITTPSPSSFTLDSDQNLIFSRNIPSSIDFSSKSHTSIIYIGDSDSRFLYNLTLRFNQIPIHLYDPQSSSPSFSSESQLVINRMISKRYFIIDKLQHSSVVGIVVGTLGVSRYTQIIQKLVRIIQSASKSHYLFVVGKLSSVKLGSYEHVDVFVLISCNENGIVDSKEFLRPIATPFELQVALEEGKKWTGEYEPDWRKLLSQGGEKEEEKEEEGEQGEGKKEEAENGDRSLKVIEEGKKEIVSKLESPALEWLKGRTYKGLEMKVGETEVMGVVQGRSGIAKGYDEEK